MKPIVRTLFFYTVTGLTVLFILFPLGCIARLKPAVATQKWFTALLWWAYTCIVWSTQLPLTVQGQEHILDEPAIIVANHQSALDIPYIGSVLGRRAQLWLFKQELTKIPILGKMLPAIGVSVDRRVARQAVASIQEVIERVEKHPATIVIFPEGGRYVKDGVQHFLAGFALIARAIRYPVIPIYIQGLGAAYGPASCWLYTSTVTLKIGPPLYVQPQETEQQFIDRVRRWFLEQQ